MSSGKSGILPVCSGAIERITQTNQRVVLQTVEPRGEAGYNLIMDLKMRFDQAGRVYSAC